MGLRTHILKMFMSYLMRMNLKSPRVTPLMVTSFLSYYFSTNVNMHLSVVFDMIFVHTHLN